MKSTLVTLALACGVTAASAHGIARPRHGGQVDAGGETTFELVQNAGHVTVFVDDHGKPVDVRGATAELLLESETGRRIALLKASGPNSLSGACRALKPGERVFVRLTLAKGSIEVGEFRLK